MLKPVLKTLLVAGGILSPALAWGGILTADEAKGVATEFFRNAELSRLASPDALTLAHVESVASAPAYYVFNATDERGFIIVSADDSACGGLFVQLYMGAQKCAGACRQPA